jgi:hypothetical protein
VVFLEIVELLVAIAPSDVTVALRRHRLPRSIPGMLGEDDVAPAFRGPAGEVVHPRAEEG